MTFDSKFIFTCLSSNLSRFCSIRRSFSTKSNRMRNNTFAPSDALFENASKNQCVDFLRNNRKPPIIITRNKTNETIRSDKILAKNGRMNYGKNGWIETISKWKHIHHTCTTKSVPLIYDIFFLLRLYHDRMENCTNRKISLVYKTIVKNINKFVVCLAIPSLLLHDFHFRFVFVFMVFCFFYLFTYFCEIFV